jgi:hypothetical protein
VETGQHGENFPDTSPSKSSNSLPLYRTLPQRDIALQEEGKDNRKMEIPLVISYKVQENP